YGAMFVLAALLFTLRTRWMVTVGAAAAVAGAGMAWWRLERRLDGNSTAWLGPPAPPPPPGPPLRGRVARPPPLPPGAAFFCAGIVLGRALAHPAWRPVAVIGGLTTFSFATLLSAAIALGDRAALVSVDPFDRGLLYTASALGTALAAFGIISWLAERHR